MDRGFANTSGGAIHWRSVDGPGDPVVLLHRTPVDSSSFDGVLQRLAGQRAAIAPDTPGFGQSFHPAGHPATTDYARWFAEALDSLGMTRVHIFAHHTGTHMAAEMAAAQPDRVLSLTLSGVMVLGADGRRTMRDMVGDSPRSEATGEYLAATWKRIAKLFKHYDPALVHAEVLGALACAEGSDQAFDAIFAQDFHEVLGRVRAPVRVFQADDDLLASGLGGFRQTHPHIPVEVFAGPAEMAAPERQPDAIADAILRYTAFPAIKPTESPMTDRQFQLKRNGAGFDLVRTEGPTPEPAAGEVLMRVHAVSLNRRDVSIRDLSYPTFSDLFTPLSDAAGEIVAVGPGVTGVAVGDRVTSTFFEDWPDGRLTMPAIMSALGSGGRGVLADHIVLSAEGVAPMPGHLSFEEASTIPCAAVTAWAGLVTHGRIQPGDWVLTIGTGGVALFGVQFAKALGARVVALSSSDEKLARAKTLGAEIGINYRATPEWEKAVKELTDGGVDHVLELGGAGTLSKSLASLTLGGHLALIGGLTGFGGDLSSGAMIMTAGRATGFSVGSKAEHLAVSAFMEKHGLKPQIDSVFELDAIDQAYERADAGALGKVVVRLR